MFDHYQDQLDKKRDEWFYPTLIVAVLTIIFIAVFTLNYSNLLFVSSLFSTGRKVEGKILIVKSQAKVNFDSIKVCAIAENKIINWINVKNAKAEEEIPKAKLKVDYARYATRQAAQDYDAATNSDERSKAEATQSEKTSRFSKAEVDYRYWFSPAFYFNGLKGCDTPAIADSDGNFYLTLKEGKYALAAQAVHEKEEFFWLIWLTPENSAKSITLNSDNLMSANPPERVFEIKNF